MPPRSLMAIQTIFVSLLLAAESSAWAQSNAASGAGPASVVDDKDDIRAPSWITEEPAQAAGVPVSGPLGLTHRRTESEAPLWIRGLGFSTGAHGVLRSMSADTGILGQLRLQFGGEFSSGSDVIIRGDKNTRLGGAITGSYSPWVGVELFGALLGSSNKNQRICSGGTCQSEEGRVDPEVIRSFGDLVMGAKFGKQINLEWALAAYGQTRLYSSTDGVFFDFGSTSLAFGGIATWDLSLRRDLPLRLHVNLGGVVDNSSNLQDFQGVAQPSELSASFGYGIARSRLQNLVALESTPWRLSSTSTLSTFVEYQLDWITGAANSRFEGFTSPTCNNTSGRACQENRDQQRFAFGVRSQFSKVWSVTGALDFGFRSVGFPYGPPQAPFTMVLQLGRAFDFGDTGGAAIAVAPLPPPSPPAEEEPDDGLVTGKVTSAADKTPIGNAIVGLVGRARSRVATDADGSFTTHDIAPGVVNLEISANGFEPQTLRTQINAGLATEVEIQLSPKVESVVRGQVVDSNGKGLVGRLEFSGSSSTSTATDAQGRYELALPAGVYILRAEVPGHLMKEQRFSLDANAKAELNFVLRPRKEVASADYVAGRGLVVRLPLLFQPQPNGLPVVLSAASMQLLDEIVDVLVARPRITRLSIEAHWDSGGIGKTDPQEVTNLQVHAIGDYLQAQGVAADRLNLLAKGSSHPLAPNVGRGRIRNRRVVLTATEEK
jgi:hypothetical protein